MIYWETLRRKERGVLEDVVPSRVISMGLVLAGIRFRQQEKWNAIGLRYQNGGKNMNKIYIGYDLGDGESITDYISSKKTGDGEKTLFIEMSMPGIKEAGKAIPTVFGYNMKGELVFANQILSDPELVHDIKINFKRRPLDLCKVMTNERQVEVLGIFTKAHAFPSQRECPECYTPGMDEFRKSVVTFTNAVFENKPYKESIRSNSIDCEEIVFCVGHPTRWNDLDVAIYESILKESVLGKKEYDGKKSNLILEKESRAAFLTVKDKMTQRVLPKGTSALLIDIGSSTIDITALEADSRNFHYNSGNNYLGARSIDFIIKKMYLEKLQQGHPEEWNKYQELERFNESFGESVTLACRMAKEKMYADYFPDVSVKIDPDGVDFKMRARTSEIDEYIKNHSVADVLTESISLPPEEQRRMGSKNWVQLFRDFMIKEKSEISERSIKIGCIILTGSASKMPFVPEIVKEVFSELPSGGVLADMNPSRTISMGLALVGLSNDKSAEFQNDVNQLIDKELPRIIEKDLPNLAESLSSVIDREVTSIIKEHMGKWRSGNIETMNDMTGRIKRDCSEANLQKRLLNNKDYNNAIRSWTVDVVGKDISLKLGEICKKYKVSDLVVGNLNIFQVPDIGNINVDVDVLDFADAIITIVSVIAGIITAVVLPTVLAIVISLISWISVGLAILLLEILAAIPGAGLAVLIAIAGVAVAKAAISGLKAAKDEVLEKMQGANLPQWVRNRVKDEKIDAKIKEAGIKEKIKQSILEEDSKRDIIKAVSESLRGQVEKRAESIKYEIESM